MNTSLFSKILIILMLLGTAAPFVYAQTSGNQGVSSFGSPQDPFTSPLPQNASAPTNGSSVNNGSAVTDGATVNNGSAVTDGATVNNGSAVTDGATVNNGSAVTDGSVPVSGPKPHWITLPSNQSPFDTSAVPVASTNNTTSCFVKIESLSSLLHVATCFLTVGIIPMLFSLAIITFIWGIITYVMGKGDPKVLEKGRWYMVWGIVALFVMVAVWGLVKVLGNTFGINTILPLLPE